MLMPQIVMMNLLQKKVFVQKLRRLTVLTTQKIAWILQTHKNNTTVTLRNA
jgi:hypothetical protein